MTLNTNERERARPVEGCGRAIAEAALEDYMEDWRRYDAAARAALAYLVSHGWLTPEYFEARKAEEKAAESGRNVDVSA